MLKERHPLCQTPKQQIVHHINKLTLFSKHFRPNKQERSLQAQIRSSKTIMWTSHQPHTSLKTWSLTASTLSGWPVTAARGRPTGRPGWSCAPKKEVRPPAFQERRCLFSIWHGGQVNVCEGVCVHTYLIIQNVAATLWLFCCRVLYMWHLLHVCPS